MSGFKDTFTKEEGGEKNLDYDDSAFYYFAAVLLTLVLIPLIYYFFKYKVLKYSSDEKSIPLQKADEAVSCSCTICMKKKEKKSLLTESAFGLGGWLQLLMIIGLLYLSYLITLNIQDSPAGIKTFDPYEILQIEVGAPSERIKQAFREMTKKHHPDKNRDDPRAHNRYMMITKAYETLTNDDARANYEKYGNPDGPTPLKFAIGLPRFLLKTENHISVLIVFFVVVIVLIPGAVLFWISNSQQVDKNGVLQDNYRRYAGSLSENLNLKKCLIMISLSAEFECFKVSRSEHSELTKLRVKYSGFLPKKQNILPRIIKVMLLLVAFTTRSRLSSSLRKDLNFILLKAGNMLETMLDLAKTLNMIPRAKRMSVRTFLMLIEAAQLLTQGLYMHASNLLMVPHLDESSLKLLTTKKKPKVADIKNDPDFTKLAQKLAAHKLQDIREVLRYLPDMKLTVEALVEGETDIQVGDIATVQITVQRSQLQEGQYAGPVHSNVFPYTKFEKLWILICDPELNRVFYIAPVFSLERTVCDSNFKFLIGPSGMDLRPGLYKWEVHVKSDSYYGLDCVETLEFTVFPSTKKEIFVHPDDANLENQKTWIQTAMGGMQPEDTSEEEELPELLNEYEEVPELAEEEDDDPISL